jgi:hypothetical protein
MGKRNKKSAKKRARKEEGSSSDGDDDLLAAAAAWADQEEQKEEEASSAPKKKRITTSPRLPPLPPPFPTSLHSNLPSRGFLRDEEPYRKAFDAALETAYEGCVWDEPDTFDEPKIQSAFESMSEAGLFRTDVTQPAGLRGNCVKTFVTRCLLGDEGT